TTNGAPAMVGKQKGFVKLLEDQIGRLTVKFHTNTAVTLKPVIMQGTAFNRMEWKSINCMKKLVQIQTDIIFLSKCKQMDIVPKGLKILLDCKDSGPKYFSYVKKSQVIKRCTVSPPQTEP
ncbi:hypothetical protein UY3_17826, partial [Chelonia mydas]